MKCAYQMKCYACIMLLPIMLSLVFYSFKITEQCQNIDKHFKRLYVCCQFSPLSLQLALRFHYYNSYKTITIVHKHDHTAGKHATQLLLEEMTATPCGCTVWTRFSYWSREYSKPAHTHGPAGNPSEIQYAPLPKPTRDYEEYS